jgi:aconitate hydratase
VLTIVEMLRKHGVVGKFVEFYGPAVKTLPMGDRTTIANMAPEYGATCGLFPIDDETLDFLRLTGRSDEQVALVEAYAKAQGMFDADGSFEADFSETLALDIGTVVPSLAGPKRPQDRVALTDVKAGFEAALKKVNAERGVETKPPVKTGMDGQEVEIGDGAVVIAAITSCTNTSNPTVMLGAGLVAKKAAERGLRVPPWVKTSLGPGSMVVTRYLEESGLMGPLKQLGFHVVGYGCTTCIGNSGPLRPEVSKAIADGDLTVASVLSGNRNFEGRVHAEVRMNYLASPPLVVAYAIAGRMGFDPYNEPLATDPDGNPCTCATSGPPRARWPTRWRASSARTTSPGPTPTSSRATPAGSASRRPRTRPSPGTTEHLRAGAALLPGHHHDAGAGGGHRGRALSRAARRLGDDGSHLARRQHQGGQPRRALPVEHGVQPADFNSYGSRRGNHQVMMRGTFANIRLRNKMAPGTEGGVTLHQPSGEQMSIYDAAMRYQADGVPAIVLAGKEYGSGSSRDWAAKGPLLLGVRAVIAESYERIHRTNLVCMGVLPLQFQPGDSAEALGLTGYETFSIAGLDDGRAKEVTVTATADDGSTKQFQARVRIDTPNEVEYYQHGGILHYVLRKLAQ